MNNKTTTHNEHCVQDSRITVVEERLNTITSNEEKIESTLKKLDETQDRLTISITELTSTFNFLKWLVAILIGLFSGVSTYVIIELIKFI